MEIFALVPAALYAVNGDKKQEPMLPQFKPKFWYNPEKLDARPVAWSLRNRPEEWELKQSGCTIVHKPSGHVFWVASGRGFYRLYEADCGCSANTTSKFQRFQQGVFHRAFRAWRKHQALASGVHENFAGHFVH